MALSLVNRVRPETDRFANSKPVARWSDVPNQHFTSGPVNIGLVAYHPRGIKRVEFTVNKVPVATVYTETLNTRYAASRPMIGDNTMWGTYPGEMEYLFPLTIPSDPGSRQLLLVEAIVYPNVGKPRFMFGRTIKWGYRDDPAGFEVWYGGIASIPATIVLNDPDPTVVQTGLDAALDACVSGTKIEIWTDGLYTPGKASRSFRAIDHWVIIEGKAANVQMASPSRTITSSFACNVERIKFINVIFRTELFNIMQGAGGREDYFLWKCGLREMTVGNEWPNLVDPDKSNSPSFQGNVYFIDCYAFEASWALCAGMLNRNCYTSNAYDNHQDNCCVLDVIVGHFEALGTSIQNTHHHDGWQGYGYHNCVFIRKMRSLSTQYGVQWIFICQELGNNASNYYGPWNGDTWGMDGAVFQDCWLISADGTEAAYTQMQGNLKDVYFDNVTLVQKFIFSIVINRSAASGSPKIKNMLLRDLCSDDADTGWTDALVAGYGHQGRVFVENTRTNSAAPVARAGSVPTLIPKLGDGKTIGSAVYCSVPEFDTANLPTQIRWQWQRSTDGGVNWANCERNTANGNYPKAAYWWINSNDKASANVRLRVTLVALNRAGQISWTLNWNPN